MRLILNMRYKEKIIMKLRKIALLMLAVSLTTGTLLTGCSKDSKEDQTIKFKVGYPATSSNVIQGLQGIAKAQGFFDEELSKVDAEIETIPFTKAGPAINAALESGDLDGAIRLGDVPSIVAKSSGSATTLIDIQPFDYSTHLIIRKGLNITNVKDLKGKKVAVQTSSYMQRILYQIFSANGLSPSDVEIINMSEVEAAAAITAGSIDATAATELKAVKLEESGSVDLLFDTEAYPEMAGMLSTIVRTEFAEEHPEVIEAYFKALLKAQDYAAEHPEDLRQICIDGGLEESVVDLTYPKLSDYGAKTGTTEETKNNFKTVIAFLKENGIIAKEVDLDSWYNDSFYKNAKKNAD